VHNPEFEKKYKCLKKPIEEYLKYNKRRDIIRGFVFAVYVFWIIFTFFWTFLDFERVALLFYTVIVFGIIASTCLPIIYWFRRKARLFKPEADDLAFYYIYEVLNNINSYKTNRHHAIGTVYRKKALSNAKSLISVIDTNWTFGDFRLIVEMFGNNIDALISGLNDVVKVLKKGDYRKITEIEGILYQFAQFLLRPTFESFGHSVELLANIRFKKVEKKFLEKLSSVFHSHSVIMHISIITAIFSIGFIPALSVIYLGSGSLDTALIVFSTIFGPSIAVYLSVIFKTEKTT
jgi:hypothetical protein